MRTRMLLLLLLALVPVREQQLHAPAPRPYVPITQDAVFPDDFIFGASTADEYTTGGGVQFIDSYKEDDRLAGQIGIHMLRVDLNWSALEPVEGQWDWHEVLRVRAMLRTLRKYRIEPMVGLSHHEPEWFIAKSGWEHPDAPRVYGRLARFIASNIGIPCRVRWWISLNEPQDKLRQSYVIGIRPPYRTIHDLRTKEGREDIDRIMRVGGIMMDAHRRAYRAIHHIMDPYGKAMIGFASVPWMFYPRDPNFAPDNAVYTLCDTGSLLFDYFVGPERDFVGLNFYGHADVTVGLRGVRVRNSDSLSGRATEPYPHALYDLIMKFKDLGVPIIITENGINDQYDQWREEYIVTHLKAVHDAIRDGAPVIAYLHWDLTDEWPGVKESDAPTHFGLIAFDRSNGFTRRIQPSALTYGDIIAHHRIPVTLLEKYHASLP
jgi:beta-glucosidase